MLVLNFSQNAETKSFRRGLSLVSVALLCLYNPFASAEAADDPSSTSTASASATVYKPLTIANSAPLNFGTFSTMGYNGSVTVDPAGIGSRTASPSGIALLSGTFSRASFYITGEANKLVTLTIPSVNLSGDDGGVMPLALYTSWPDSATGESVGIATASHKLISYSSDLTTGSNTVYVGGTLTVSENQKPGFYSGNIIVTATYQ